MVGVVVTLILLLVSGIILISIYLTIGTSIIESSGQAFCALSSAIRSKTNIPGINLKVYPELCESSVVNIVPTDSSKCLGYTAFLAQNNKDNPDLAPQKDPKKCAQEQIVKLAANCWTQRGRGGLNPGDFTCFYSCVEPYYTLDKGEKEPLFLSREEAIEEPEALINNFRIGDSSIYEALLLRAASISGKNISYSNIISNSEMDVKLSINSGQFIKIDFEDDTGKKPKDKIIITTLGTGC